MMLKQRNLAIDMMKGIAILLMMVGHRFDLPYFKELIRPVIYSFHMPLFFILAGYFMSIKYDFRTSVRKDVKRLFLPYFATQAVLCLYAFVCYYVRSSNYDIANKVFLGALFPASTSFAVDSPLWFLAALFWCKFFFQAIVSAKHKLGVAILVFVSLLMVPVGEYALDYSVFAIFQGISALAFFCFGYLLKQYKNQILSKRHMVFLMLCVWIVAMRYSQMDCYAIHFVNFPLAIAGALSGTYCVYRISQLLILNFGGGNFLCKYLIWIGENSMIVLCVHSVEKYINLQTGIMSNCYLHLFVEILICSFSVWACYKFRVTRKIFCLK